METKLVLILKIYKKECCWWWKPGVHLLHFEVSRSPRKEPNLPADLIRVRRRKKQFFDDFGFGDNILSFVVLLLESVPTNLGWMSIWLIWKQADRPICWLVTSSDLHRITLISFPLFLLHLINNDNEHWLNLSFSLSFRGVNPVNHAQTMREQNFSKFSCKR